MINVLSKICPELLKVVSLNLSKEPVNDCIIYTNNYKKLREALQPLFCIVKVKKL